MTTVATLKKKTYTKSKKGTAKYNKTQTKKQNQTQKILAGEKLFDLQDTFPKFQLLGEDNHRRKVEPFDFVAQMSNGSNEIDFVEQADCNCSNWKYGGTIINSPLTKAWKTLENELLKTIRSHKEEIKISHAQVEITIHPFGGSELDCDPEDKSKYYPTFEFKNTKTNDTISYEYFQLSAHDRALIALDLIEMGS